MAPKKQGEREKGKREQEDRRKGGEGEKGKEREREMGGVNADQRDGGVNTEQREVTSFLTLWCELQFSRDLALFAAQDSLLSLSPLFGFRGT